MLQPRPRWPSAFRVNLDGCCSRDTLQRHPLAGPKIKRLKGRLHDYYRYRVGDYRIVYAVTPQEHIVYVDYIQHRKDIYRSIQ